jgi:formylglycine-generating enzyme
MDGEAQVPAVVPVPGGRFGMGSARGRPDEHPVHEAEVGPFRLARTAVTRAQYAAFVRATRPEVPPGWSDPAFSAPDQPVVGVTWHEATVYAEWLSETAGGRWRLPTEAEWERAARGGIDGRRYPWGDEIPGWIPEEGRGPLAGPWPVTLGEPNGFEVFGIAANIHEWCADWYASDFYASSPDRNPSGPERGVRRASRGGSWRHAVTISRCATRSRIDPSFRYTDYGFRVVRSAAGATCSTGA